MLSKNNLTQRDQLEMVALDQLFPQNHLVRKLEAALDFSFIYELVKDVYSEVDRPRRFAPAVRFLRNVRKARITKR